MASPENQHWAHCIGNLMTGQKQVKQKRLPLDDNDRPQTSKAANMKYSCRVAKAFLK